MTATAALTLQDTDARIEKLTQALFHVVGEMWVMRDRQAVLERVLEEGGITVTALINSYRPDAALAETLTIEREAFLSTILGYLAPDA